MENTMPMTPYQRRRLRQYLNTIRSRKLHNDSLKNKSKIFSGIKKTLKVGFWFFLAKGIFWLLVLFGIVEFL
jgi:hypothetical protein